MVLSFFLKGILIGSLVGIPLGPIGALATRKVLTDGPRYGLMYGLGSALADLLYATAAGWGLSLVARFLMTYHTTFKIIGGIIVMFLGIRIFFSKPVSTPATEPPLKALPRWSGYGYLGAFFTALILALINPVTFFSFLGLITFLGLEGLDKNSIFSILELVTGVFLGSFSWWLFLSYGTWFLKKKFKPESIDLAWLNHIFGIIIFLLGLVILVKL